MQEEKGGRILNIYVAKDVMLASSQEKIIPIRATHRYTSKVEGSKELFVEVQQIPHTRDQYRGHGILPAEPQVASISVEYRAWHKGRRWHSGSRGYPRAARDATGSREAVRAHTRPVRIYRADTARQTWNWHRHPPPIWQPLRQHPFHYQDAIDEQVDEMKKHGIIQLAASPWTSNVVLVNKKGGSLWFCVDYRQLTPSPSVNNCLNALQGSSWFSILVYKSWQWQHAHCGVTPW